MKINWYAWSVLPIFKLIQETGSIDDEEMRKVFNLGIGLIAVISKETASLLKLHHSEKRIEFYEIGEVV